MPGDPARQSSDHTRINSHAKEREPWRETVEFCADRPANSYCTAHADMCAQETRGHARLEAVCIVKGSGSNVAWRTDRAQDETGEMHHVISLNTCVVCC